MKFKEYINESGNITDLKKLEKALAKEFDIKDLMELNTRVYSPYGYSKGEAVYEILEKFNLEEKGIISKSAYVKYQVWRSENGYGNYGTPRKVYQEEWEKMKDDGDFEELINYNAEVLEGKFFSKMASIITKKIGKPAMALVTLKIAVNSHDNSYDRNLSFEKFVTPRLSKLWYNKRDIYALFDRASLRDENSLELYNWLKEK